jgi:hypothetical protein
VATNSEDSFALLGSACWQEVERSTRGAVRARRTPEGVELRLFHLVTPVQAGVARELVDGLRSETVARENEIAALVPFAPQVALPARDAT